MFAYYLLKVIREPMILAEGSAELKAYSTAAQAVLLMLIVPVFARLYQQVSGREGKHLLLTKTLAFFICNLIAFGLAYRQGWPVAIFFYIWLGIFSVMVLALFWAFAADLFNLKSGQRIFPLIAAASALGALLGSGSASELDLLIGHDGVMYCAALLLALPLWLSRWLENEVPSESCARARGMTASKPYPLLEGFKVVLRSHYLGLIAVFVILINLINTNGEYVLASLVEAVAETPAAGAGLPATAGEDYITRFYSRYLFITTGLGFLIQLLLVSRIFRYAGIRGALYVLPLLMILSYSLLALFPLLVVARAAMIAENSVSYSLQTTTRHALFLPVSRKEKYIGKHTIDTFLFRVGDVLSGGFVYLAGATFGLGVTGFAAINILLATGLLAVSRAIGRNHDSAASAYPDNQPPVALSYLPDLHLPAGETSRLQLDANTFVDPDLGDAMKYQAFESHAARLPAWIKFDSLSRSFLFEPPAASRGSVRIRVVARDFDGLEAEICFTVNYDA
jgi:AAA family ATP:ADP antiporter